MQYIYTKCFKIKIVFQNATDSPDSGDGGSGDGTNHVEPLRKLSVYERMSLELTTDDRTLKEVTLGKRIGFYRIRGDLGCGNFSQVKLGTHVLSRGNYSYQN